ncbi:DMT family transporter [Elstera sp.]|jgi:drug/metabolite transporter (DMT)-like permease|uniref:DMT family transporter n=1 Tax=Elstera sp. TaxID=1916664 RepID=UPI0037C1438C
MMMQEIDRRGVTEMVAAMLISGTIGWLVLVSGQDPVTVVFFRCLIGALVLSLLARRLPPTLWTQRTLILAGIGGLALVGNWLLLFASFSRASISMATAAYNVQPFILVALAALVRREALPLWKFIWLSVAFGGLLLVVQVEPDVLLEPGAYLTGIALALGAAFLYAVFSLITKQLTGIAPQRLARLQLVIGTVILAPMLAWHSLPTAPQTWGVLVLLGVVHTGLMYALLYSALQRLPTSLTAALSFIYPIAAILVDYVAFGQKLHPSQIIGGALILTAVAGVSFGWSFKKRLPLEA